MSSEQRIGVQCAHNSRDKNSQLYSSDERVLKIYLEQHLSYFEMVLMTLTAQSVSACLPALREHYSKKCTMFAKEIESLVLDTEQHRPVGGNIQIILLFSRFSGGQSDCGH